MGELLECVHSVVFLSSWETQARQVVSIGRIP